METKDYVRVAAMDRTFHQFSQLPTELRIKIWSLVAPDPCMLKQGRHWDTNSWRFSHISYRNLTWYSSPFRGPDFGSFSYGDKRGLRFYRRTPVILQVCRESRMEFLGDGRGEHTRKHHPVYQLCVFDALDPPVYFSSVHDSVLATVSGIRRIQIKQELQYLFLDTVINDFSLGTDFLVPFTSLKIITILLRTPLPFGSYHDDTIPPELNGEVDWEGLSSFRKIELRTERDWIRMSFGSTKRKNPGWRMPVLRFRLIEQFLKECSAS